MTLSVFVNLVNNAALLLSLSLIYEIVAKRPREGPTYLWQAVTGFILGAIGISVMATSFVFRPGIVFDTRSVLISICGLFFGILPTLIVVLMTSFYRLHLGGLGVLPGIAVIITSAIIGLGWRYLRRTQPTEFSLKELYLFGLVVHINMILLMFTLPPAVARHVLSTMTLPVLLIYPPATALLGYLMVLQATRHQIHSALEQSERRYRSLFENVPIGLYRSMPDGHILDANRAFVEMFGFSSREQLYSRKSWEFYASPEDYQRWKALMNREGVVRGFETRLKRADGSIIWVRETARVVHDEGNDLTYYEGSVEDITARKEAEEARARLLAETERRATYQQTLNFVITTGATARSLDIMLHDVLKRVLDVLGLSRGCIWIDEVHVAHGFSQEFLDALQGIQWTTEWKGPIAISDWKHAQSKEMYAHLAPMMLREKVRASVIVPIWADHERIGGLGVAAETPQVWDEDTLDLVEAIGRELGAAAYRLRLLEEAQQRAHLATRLAALAEQLNRPQKVTDVVAAIGSGAMALTRADRAAVYVRSEGEFRCLWRHALSERYITSILSHVHQVPGRSFLQGTAPMLITDVEDLDDEPYFRRLARQEGIRALAGWALVYESQTVAVVVCYYNSPRRWDNVELEMMATWSRQAAIALRHAYLAEALEQSNEELRRALQARDDMLRNVTHELRTPLTMVQGYAELILDGTLKSSKELEEAASIILRNARHLEHLIHQLLLFQRLASGTIHLEPIDVSGWLRDALAGWRQALKRSGLRLEVEVPEGLGVIKGHLDYLNQVVYNLLDNARKFSPAGGTITVRAWNSDGYVYVSVADEGIGIEPNQLERIFERFYQVDTSTTRRFGGMGIGLALVKEIIALHGGRVWAESEGKGKGTTIVFLLPRI